MDTISSQHQPLITYSKVTVRGEKKKKKLVNLVNRIVAINILKKVGKRGIWQFHSINWLV